MAITINLPRPASLRATLAKTSRVIRDNGGNFLGDEVRGSFSGGGIKGIYEVGEQLRISILEKPFIYPASLIENQIRDFFKSA
jgi:hypothetical protein